MLIPQIRLLKLQPNDWRLLFSVCLSLLFYRVAGTVAVKLVKPAVAATQRDTVAHFANTKTGRSTTTSVDRLFKLSSKETHQQSAPPQHPTVGPGVLLTHHQQLLLGPTPPEHHLP